jgi:hypothetical protein
MEQAIMKPTKLLLLLLVAFAAALSGADLGNVHTVYMLPMAHGLDQYLANVLTAEHIFVIVTDPKAADAVLTDHVNPALQEKLDTLLAPPPPPPKEGEKDEPKGTLLDPANKLSNGGEFQCGPQQGHHLPGDHQVPPGALVGVRPAEGYLVQTIGSHRLRYCKPPQEGHGVDEEVTLRNGTFTFKASGIFLPAPSCAPIYACAVC